MMLSCSGVIISCSSIKTCRFSSNHFHYTKSDLIKRKVCRYHLIVRGVTISSVGFGSNVCPVKSSIILFQKHDESCSEFFLPLICK